RRGPSGHGAPAGFPVGFRRLTARLRGSGPPTGGIRPTGRWPSRPRGRLGTRPPPRPVAGGPMAAQTDPTPIDVVRKFLAALERFDVDEAASLLAPEVEYQNVPFPPARGREAVVKQLRGLERYCSSFAVRYHNIAAV